MKGIVRNLERDMATLLNVWGLPMDSSLFYGEGWALLANLVNCSAKVLDQKWYNWKPYLVQRALHEVMNAWFDEEQGIAYVETLVAQVSFHMNGDLEYYPLPDTGRQGEWSGEPTQFQAPYLIAEYIGESYYHCPLGDCLEGWD